MNRIIIISIIVIIVIAALAAYFTVFYKKTPPTTSTTPTSSITKTITTTSSTITTITSNTTSTAALPPGAKELQYNPNNKTVFIYLVVSVTGPQFNYNGTSYGQMKIYVPAGWNVMLILTNYQPIPHNANIVMNNTPMPNNADISKDGKILLYVGDSPSNFMYNGLQQQQTASGILDNISAGYYWIACGITGHAESGMWVDLIVSNSVSIPYYIISSST
jgi:sulfocyanin